MVTWRRFSIKRLLSSKLLKISYACVTARAGPPRRRARAGDGEYGEQDYEDLKVVAREDIYDVLVKGKPGYSAGMRILNIQRQEERGS